jgi:hypothetical protein
MIFCIMLLSTRMAIEDVRGRASWSAERWYFRSPALFLYWVAVVMDTSASFERSNVGAIVFGLDMLITDQKRVADMQIVLQYLQTRDNSRVGWPSPA